MLKPCHKPPMGNGEFRGDRIDLMHRPHRLGRNGDPPPNDGPRCSALEPPGIRNGEMEKWQPMKLTKKYGGAFVEYIIYMIIYVHGCEWGRNIIQKLRVWSQVPMFHCVV